MFWQVLVARFALGIGEAFCNPPAYSLISDLFPPEKRSTANGIYAFGVYVGGGLASLSTVLNSQFGWRVTLPLSPPPLLPNTPYRTPPIHQNPTPSPFRSRSTPSASLASSCPSSSSPPCGSPPAQPTRASQRSHAKSPPGPQPFRTSSLFLKSPPFAGLSSRLASASSAATVRLSAASTHRPLPIPPTLRPGCDSAALGTFLPKFFKIIWTSNYDTYGILNSFVVSIGGAFSAFVGGWVADWWGKRSLPSCEPPHGGRYFKSRAAIPAIGALLATPFVVGVFLFNNFYGSIFSLLGALGRGCAT